MLYVQVGIPSVMTETEDGFNDRPFNYCAHHRQSNPAEKVRRSDRAAGSTKFTPSPLWAEPREPEPRFLHRTKLSSRPPAIAAAAAADAVG